VANCPGFKTPLEFSISASTVRVRDVGVTLGEIRAIRPLKLRSGHALVVTDTDWPTLTVGIACSGISMRTRKGLIRTMVATLLDGDTYSPRSAVRSATYPSMGEKTSAYERFRRANASWLSALATFARAVATAAKFCRASETADSYAS